MLRAKRRFEGDNSASDFPGMCILWKYVFAMAEQVMMDCGRGSENDVFGICMR